MKITVDPRAAHSPGEVAVVLVTTAQREQTGVAVEEFSAAANAVLRLPERHTIFVGLGSATAPAEATVSSAAAAAALFARKHGLRRLHFDFTASAAFVEPAAIGAVIGNYRFEQFREKKSAPVDSIRFTVGKTSLPAARRSLARGLAVGDAANFARQLGNQPGNYFQPATLVKEARALAKRAGLKIRVFDERALEAGGFGGLLAVGRGSAHPPRMVVLEHRGGPAKEAPIVLVGKAVTFDSGGLSLKPGADMQEMIFDKCGGMAVLGAMSGIAALGLKRNISAVIASAENLPGPNAYRPGDIVTAYDGKTIEIINTDAEGRVILADAIGYARKNLRARAIIDLATLTGACGVALGEYAAGLWSTDEKLRQGLLAAAERTGERLWPMPSFEEYHDQTKSAVARLKNTGGRLGGACTAAAFLQVFAENVPWAHLDIAYMASLEKDRAQQARGATGFGVRLLLAWLSAL